MLKSLPPVGTPILLKPVEVPEEVFEASFGDRLTFLYNSGTEALAASLMAVKQSRGIESPEVLLPAYACPDLVSAALFAGVKPVLVDLEANTPWMDLNKLKDQISSNTIAVMATHFLGISERLEDIKNALEGSGVLMIEDSAQLFPKPSTEKVWTSDLVVLSFGRGKPVSLLGGGAVLCRNEALAKHLPDEKMATLNIGKNKPGFSYKCKVRLYNSLLHPGAYGLLKRAPFLQLGETIYKPLTEITLFDNGRVPLLAANINFYQSRERKQQDWLAAMLGGLSEDSISDLSKNSTEPNNVLLLRYPVLLKDARLRENLFNALTRQGLGCSKMYPQPLSEIKGLEECFQGQPECPQAKSFSQRLLTLPCHPGVSPNEVKAMGKVCEAIFKSSDASKIETSEG